MWLSPGCTTGSAEVQMARKQAEADVMVVCNLDQQAERPPGWPEVGLSNQGTHLFGRRPFLLGALVPFERILKLAPADDRSAPQTPCFTRSAPHVPTRLGRRPCLLNG